MAGVLKSPWASSHTTARSRWRRCSPATAARAVGQSPVSSSGLLARATASATAWCSRFIRPPTGPAGRAGQIVSVTPAGTGKAGMCSSRCQGATMGSQGRPLLWSAMGCLSFAAGELFPLGEQVEQPLQLGGAGVQVCGELGAGLCRAAVQRVQQLAVVVRGAAEFAAGALGQCQGKALLLLELPVETAQPGAAGGRDQGGVEEPVTVEHGGGVAAVEGAFYLLNQVG